jgi:hypothetical protein
VTILAYFLWDEEELKNSPSQNSGQVSEGGNL